METKIPEEKKGNKDKDKKEEGKSKLTEEEKREYLAKLEEAMREPKKYEIKKYYKFWGEQPVPQFDRDIGIEFGPINKNCKVEDELQIPYKLPEGFSWKDVDVTNDNELNKLADFLRDNYVEDEGHMFRFDYSRDFLRWHLTTPGNYKQWLISVVREEKGKLKMIGFISAIPVDISINGTKVKMGEVNFLCVKQKFRSARLAPVLIKEVTRRIHLENIWQAVYTSGTMLPKPFSTCTYYHRNINIQKLVDIKFTYLGSKMNMARAKSIYKIQKDTTIQGLRKMEEKDVVQVTELLANFLNKYKVHGFYSKEEVAHWFLPRKNVVFSYVVDNGEGKVTDFISFYSLPSSVLQHEVYKKMMACYSFFNIATSVTFKELMKNALILAKNHNFDVYNCLNIMENETVFKDLLFTKGDGKLKYYFYNFVCPETEPKDLSLILM